MPNPAMQALMSIYVPSDICEDCWYMRSGYFTYLRHSSVFGFGA